MKNTPCAVCHARGAHVRATLLFKGRALCRFHGARSFRPGLRKAVPRELVVIVRRRLG